MQRYNFYLNIIRFLRSGTIIEGIIVAVVFVVRFVFLFFIVAITCLYVFDFESYMCSQACLTLQ